MEDLRTAALYAKTLNGVEIDPAAYDVPSRGGEYYMAPQVVLTQLLKPFLLDFTIDDTGYNDLYFRMEVIVGAAVFDACGPNGLDLKYSVASNWVGRHIVDERYSQTTVAGRVLDAFNSEGRGGGRSRAGRCSVVTRTGRGTRCRRTPRRQLSHGPSCGTR